MADTLQQQNSQKFSEFKKLNLPKGEYAITGSGPMGIRGLKSVGDIDIIVSDKLWKELAKKHPVTAGSGMVKIELAKGLVDVMCQESFKNLKKDPADPSVKSSIEKAEIIDGMAFVSIEHVLYFKRKMGRKKDLDDIKLIEQYQKKQSSGS